MAKASSAPRVSIIMAVYNGQEYLNIAIDSILGQTFKDFELLIIDDGSRDDSADIIKGYGDPRVKYVYQDNQGLAGALNTGLRHAAGEYVARMDCDDISYPERLQLQVEYLDKHRTVALLGTCFDLIDLDGRIIDRSYHLTRNQDIYDEFLVRNPFGHGTIMVRRSILEKVGVYDREHPIEDYELWWRIARKFETANLPEFLYGWRVNPEGISHGGSNKRQKFIINLMQQIWDEHGLIITARQTKASVEYYEKLGPKYAEQYRYFLAAMSLGLKRQHRLPDYARLTAQLVRSAPARKVLSDSRAHPTSHNYNWKLLNRR